MGISRLQRYLRRGPDYIVTLGEFGNKEAMIKAVLDSSCEITEPAMHLIRMDEFQLLTGPVTFEFWKAEIPEIIRGERPLNNEIFSQLDRIGCEEAPSESVCALGMKYPFPPIGKPSVIYSRCVASNLDTPALLGLEMLNEEGYISTFPATGDCLWVWNVNLLLGQRRE